MNKNLLWHFVLMLFLTPSYSYAQLELWGMTAEGGYKNGVIFKTDSSGSNYSIQHYFKTWEKHPKGALILASNGKYYGMSEGGGNYGKGCIFEYDSSTDSVFILHHFDGTATGANPQGEVFQASNGYLYGMTYAGGTNNLGVVFRFDIATGTFLKVHDFGHYPLGRSPYGNLMEASDGLLYGLTSSGGTAGGNGTIFELDPSDNSLTTLYSFSTASTDGAAPLGSLLEASNGLLYGVTSQGGTTNGGTVFEFDISTSTHTKLVDFDGSLIGYKPMGTPVEATNGNLYGMFQAGSGDAYNGGLFEYNIGTSTLAICHPFGWGAGHPSWPSLGSLIEGADNMLYGMSNRGGTNDDGAIFKYNCATDVFTRVYDFSFSINNNINVYGTLLLIAGGNMLGMTHQGGTSTKGTLFEFDTTSNTLSVKHSFNSYSEGENPKGSLLAASNSKFYGLTLTGGVYNGGTLFEYDPFSGTYTKKHDFDWGATGGNPYGTLMEADNGMFYGMTMWGGANGGGVMFKYDPQTSTLTNVHDFHNSTGERPYGSLMQASNSKLYGMTSFGTPANYNRGTLFEFDISTNTYTLLQNLSDAIGKSPQGGLIETSTGILYGLTFGGGASFGGTLFEYNIGTNTITVKKELSGATDGYEPTGDPVLATNGNLYGLISKGGANIHGTLFEYDISGSTFTKKHDFQGSTTGKTPHGSLTESSDGNLYGMTGGGTDGTYFGTLFQFDPSTGVVTKKLDFNYSNGSKPHFTQLVTIVVGAVWSGAVSTDWHNPANWQQNAVPDPFSDVTIPDVSGASGNFPVVSSDIKIRKITVNSSANINIQPGVTVEVGN